MKFEWDADKAIANHARHGVTFKEAVTVFDDAPKPFDDLKHSTDEDRIAVMGWSEKSRLLTVIITLRDDVIRLISARRASKTEAVRYGET